MKFIKEKTFLIIFKEKTNKEGKNNIPVLVLPPDLPNSVSYPSSALYYWMKDDGSTFFPHLPTLAIISLELIM